ncbi:ATP-dependent helicase [Mesobacillus jeotgali]|uniref:ATP-dependent helicase n=1 Tax=Mesobacillus jeotgali TaxID=129985 RepID=UPI000C8656B7|nr:ATP-dependent DNA helicase [Mesobacillus jeotgali]
MSNDKKSAETISNQLNDQQLKVVKTTEGPLLIIAGPGSGKTFTIVERICYLITEKKIPTENILVATFTEKAAQELVTRVSNRLIELGVNVNLNEMYIGTLHSIFLRILEEYRDFTRLKSNYRLMDQFDQQYFLYQNISKFETTPNVETIIGEPTEVPRWERAESLMKWVNKVGEECISSDTLSSSHDIKVKALGECVGLYHDLLLEENVLDFSTIQIETLKLLENNPEIVDSLQSKIKYLMVDEYQDTNTIQEQILFILTGSTNNICVVGDDDQGLYRFRGASIRNILEFPSKFPTGMCQQIELTTNYRSHPKIINFYNEWMNLNDWSDRGNNFRFQKVIQPREDDFCDTATVIRVSGQDSHDNWHGETLRFLNSLKSSGKLSDWNQVAFLFKSVKSRRVVGLATFLENNGIPVYSPRSNMFFDREETKLMLGALIFLFPQFQSVRKWNASASLKVWDYYDECFGEFASHLRKSENRELLIWCRHRAKDHLHLTSNTDYAFSRLLYELLQFPLFSKYLNESSTTGVLDSRPARNLALFSQLLTKFEYLHNISVFTRNYIDKNIRDLFNQFFRFLIEGGINEYEDSSEYAPSGCVSFLTIHQSKGLEFPIVIAGSLNASPRKQYTELDELLQNEYYNKPPYEPIEKTKLYDFWRLYYTAFSRAQNLLVLSCQEHIPKSRGEKKSPSKYFEPLYSTVPNWTESTFDLNKLDFERVKGVNIKKEYSFTSHISLFENCAVQYRFFKELEFSPVRQSATLFGTVVHQTIEDIHKRALRNEEHLITQKQIETWFNKNYSSLAKRERVYLAPQIQAVALKQVLQYAQRHENNWEHIQEAEVDVSLVKENYILKGTIDLIRGKDDTVEIVDFKSEKKPDLFRERDKIDRYRRQLEVYAHLIEERIGKEVTKLHLYYTGEKDGNPYLSFNKDKKSIKTTISTFDKIVEKIEGKKFSVTERPVKICQECDMRFYCDRQ